MRGNDYDGDDKDSCYDVDEMKCGDDDDDDENENGEEDDDSDYGDG